MCDLMDCKDCKNKCKEKMNDKELEQLWEEFEDVLFVEEDNGTLVLASDWQGFDAGTDRETIWHWFDEHHSKHLHYSMFGE